MTTFTFKGLPSVTLPIVDPTSGQINPIWYRYFNGLALNLSGFLLSANNLSDVGSPTTALSNLGITLAGGFTSTFTLTGPTSVTFPTSGTLATTASIPTGVALTKADDTNVTLTLGGSPTTALVNAASLTLGWTGTLSGTRGGTGVNNGASTITLGGNLVTSGAFGCTLTLTGTTNVTLPTSGTLATVSQIPTGAALTKTDDTNVTLTLGGSPSTSLINATSLTLGWTGLLAVNRGGTGVSTSTGTGNVVLSTSPTLVTPVLGTPSSGTLTSCTGLPIGGLTGLGTGVGTALAANVTGSGGIALATSPSFTTPTLGAATATSITFSPTTGGIVGTTTNDNTGTGKVGEFVSSTVPVASFVSLTTATPKNLTSISLTAGDWDVMGNVSFGGSSTTVTNALGWCSLTSATPPDQSAYSAFFTSVGFTANGTGLATPLLRVSIAGTTTVFLTGYSTFTSGTVTGGGQIFARRVR